MPHVLAISPHLDDAVLSAGGHLCELASEGVEVSVLTLFAGIPTPPYSLAAELLHEEWQLTENPVHERRIEDAQAVKLLGAKHVHGSFLDVIYRTDSEGQWLIELGQSPATHEANQEPELCTRLAESVAEAIGRLRPDHILTCAAVGEHIDHRRTRDAVLAAATDQVPVSCWEDLPYAHQRAAQPPTLAGGADFGPPVAEPAGHEAWEAKYQAIDCYRSQHSMLWPDVEDVCSIFDIHAWQVAQSHGLTSRAELFWPVRPAGTRLDDSRV